MAATRGPTVNASMRRLRVLIANGSEERVERIARAFADLGHVAIVRRLEPTEAAGVAREERPDLAVVALEETPHSLELISRLTHEAACPVIAVEEAGETRWAREAAARGAFAYVPDGDLRQLEGAIEVVVRRFAELRELESAFRRRALIEQAKGILMAYRRIDERKAFELLRCHSQRTGRKLSEIADCVVATYLVVQPDPTEAARPPIPPGAGPAAA